LGAVLIAALFPHGPAFGQQGGRTPQQLIDDYNRRQQELGNLRGVAQPPAGPAGGTVQSGQVKGTWTINCRLPEYPDRVFPASGTFDLTVQPNGAISGRYLHDGGQYAVTGQRQANGTAGGTAVPSSGSGAVSWQGQMPSNGGRLSASGSLTFRAPDRTCTGQWNGG